MEDIPTQHLNALLTSIEKDIQHLDIKNNPFDTAYTLTGLFYAYLKLNNVPIEHHPIKQQLARLQSVHSKMNEDTKVVNTEAITRVVQHHLGIKKSKNE